MKTKSLAVVLDEHTEVVEDRPQRILRFKDSGHLYIERSLYAIDNYDRVYVPVIDGIERADLRMRGAPFDAIAAVLKREGVIA